ncbi:MAG: histidine kinase dimerization/phospho-acceptor domain-containing protein, partial [Cyanobacteria bacterium J06600_6]
MAPGQSSFRRILLSRILLVSVPVLLVGVYVTYRKARSAFLETARQNLTESAIRKGEIVKQSIEALQNNLASASDAAIGASDILDGETLISQLSEVLPTDILCSQITDLETSSIVTSNCKEQVSLESSTWKKKKQRILTTSSQVDVKLLLPTTSLVRDTEEASENPLGRQLKLWLTAPVYDSQGDLRYALSVKSAILTQEIIEPGSLEGYPVVIDRDGTILAHPFVQRVGRNIKQMPDSQRLMTLIDNAIANKADFLHLFYLETDGVELVAGYSSIPSPITNSEGEKWIILAVSPLDAALEPLKDIRQALVGMTLGLIAACSLATLYLSRELARPLEQIRDYSLKDENLHSSVDRLPEDFQINEFNQLSLSLNDMVSRLRAWGDEIIKAWQEAQTANQLKSEFLATTSHELRTPLNGIINCIRVVQEGYCDNKEEEREFLQQADDAAIHLLGIINDVLDISKIEAGKLSVTIEPVNLGKVLHEVVDLHLVAIQQKDLRLEMPIWGKELNVLADGAKLKQVLINVVSNAVKFTDSGSITITIATELPTDQTANQELGKLERELDNYQYSLASKANYQREIEGTANNLASSQFTSIAEENKLHHDRLQQPKKSNQYVIIE